MSIAFQNRVAIVTGAGRGLGRAYARALGKRGARVVVNDIGKLRDGSGAASAEPATTVAEEIRSAGGIAMADDSDVADASQVRALVTRVLAEWGRIDILINNAGVLCGRPFHQMSDEEFVRVLHVNLMGSANMVRAVWRTMMERRYGRILMTTSGIGLYGQPDHANYGAAKMGLVGLAKTLALEGEPFDIRVNCIVPAAATRMTEDVLPPAAASALAVDRVTPAALFLVSENAPSNVILGAGAGRYHAAFVTMTRGVGLPAEEQTPEGIAKNLVRIIDRTEETVPQSCFDQVNSLTQ